MCWNNIKLIFWREVRDQLRDRRTLFTVAVLPLLLYPLLGMSFLQMAQFLRQHPIRIHIVGETGLQNDPQLFDGGRFSADACPESEMRLIDLSFEDDPKQLVDPNGLSQRALRDIHAGRYDVLVYLPPELGEQLQRMRKRLAASKVPRADSIPTETPPASGESTEIQIPQPIIYSNTANERSRIAARRAETVLSQWREAIVLEVLKENRIPLAANKPFELSNEDVAEEVSKRAAVWSKVLPFIVFIWALTGAFYPAIDLCAGEKERGTLETLLCSPALRIEIVWGKLLTTMTFSIATSLLNLACITVSGAFFVRQFEQMPGMAAIMHIGAPPILALGWLVLALVPLAALFSALSLAIASFARSSREGQYYLMPLLLVCLPLMMLPMWPAVELDLGTSFIPISGVMLLVRALIEGQYAEALFFLPPVAVVTSACCWLAIRWAVDQFNNESVLFRESERWDLKLMVLGAMRNRRETPTFAQALLCGLLLLIAQYFVSLLLAGQTGTWTQFSSSILIMQAGVIAIPAVLLSLLLTRSLPKTLLLKLPSLGAILGAALLAMALHPVGIALAGLIRQIYPIGPEMGSELARLGAVIGQAPNNWSVLALLAVLPSCCEELAFRGFILSGLRHSGRPWMAILLSSVLFGAVHSILQQSIAACVLGLVIGFLAIRTGSLVVTILFHMIYNSLALLLSLEGLAALKDNPGLGKVLVELPDHGLEYRPAVAVVSGLFALILLAWFNEMPAPASQDEILRQALDEAPSPSLAK